MTARALGFSILAMVAIMAGAAPASAATQAYLRANIIVDNNNVRLRDIFDGAGRYAEKVVAYAPAPGRKLILEAVWLHRVARAYRVSWRPASKLDRAIVERRSRIVTV